MAIGATVEFQGVKIVKASDRALCCRIGGRDHWIAPHRLLTGSTIDRFGDCGIIVLATQFAEHLGLA